MYGKSAGVRTPVPRARTDVASIEKRTRDGKASWQARWRDPAGAQRKRTFQRKVDAERHLAGVEGSKLTGGYVDISNRVTVAEYAQAWAQTRPHRRSTASRTASSIKVHIAGTALGARRLVDVRPSEVQAWATGRAAVLAPSTVRGLVSLLRSIYAAAVLDRLVASSPVARIALPRHEQERVVPLTVEQVRALAGGMPERTRAMVLTQAGLGLRIGELLGLRVQDVDFLRRSVRVESQLEGGTRVRVDTKTPRSRRTVPLPTFVADALAAHIAAFPPLPDGSLFSGKAGATWDAGHYGTRMFSRGVARAGLPAGTTSHDLRHHYASLLLAGGESVVVVAERLGHENATLVLTTYGHLMPGSEEKTRRALDDAWCAPGVPLGDATTR